MTHCLPLIDLYLLNKGPLMTAVYFLRKNHSLIKHHTAIILNSPFRCISQLPRTSNTQQLSLLFFYYTTTFTSKSFAMHKHQYCS